jgi:hypothetical protein
MWVQFMRAPATEGSVANSLAEYSIKLRKLLSGSFDARRDINAQTLVSEQTQLFPSSVNDRM